MAFVASIAAAASLAMLVQPVAAGPGTQAPPNVRASILAAIERNKGLCCKAAPVTLGEVRLSPDRRYAFATTSGGNALEGAAVFLWRGSSAWAVLEYGTDVDGCGFIPTRLIAAFVSEQSRRSCPRTLATNPFFRGSDRSRIGRALRSDTWLADADRGEQVIVERVLVLALVGEGRFAVATTEVRTRSRTTTKLALLRRGTAAWSLVDVAAGRAGLGCSLLRSVDRRPLGLPPCRG